MCTVHKHVKLSLTIIVTYNAHIIFSFLIRRLYHFSFDDTHIRPERKKWRKKEGMEEKINNTPR